MNPDICVMMPTFGQSEYLEDAIKSVMSQGRMTKVYLVWVEGDAETEDRINFLKGESWFIESTVSHPNVWVQKQEALRLTGTQLDPPDLNQLVCRFDSDDIMMTGWLEKAIPIAREIQSRGKVPIIGPSYTITDKNLKPTQKVVLPEFTMKAMLEGCIIPEYSIMPIGPLLEVGGFFDPDWQVPYRYNWYATMLRILKRYDCEVRLLPDIGFLYRQHRGQEHTRFTSRWGSRKNVDNLKLVSKHYFPEREMQKRDFKEPSTVKNREGR